MINEILESVTEYIKYDDIITELIRLKKELKKNNIKYEKIIEDILSNEKISKMLELLINKYHEKITKDNFILELTVVYRDKNKETDPDIIELMTNKTKDNQEKIIKMYDRLVYKYALKGCKQGVEIEDLAQVGRLGLLKAYDVYDINRCTKFMTVAVWWVRQYMQREISNFKRTVRIPVHVNEKIVKINIFRDEFKRKHGVEPSEQVISDSLDIPIDKVKEYLTIDRPIISMDLEIESDNSKDTSILSNIIPDPSPGPEEIVDRKILVTELNKLFKSINLVPREIFVLKKRFGVEDGEKWTLDRIGSKLGLTRERVRQLQRRALLKIKNSKYKNCLSTYVDGSIAYAIEEDSPFEFSKNTLNETEGISDSMNKKQKGLRGYFKRYDVSKLEDIISNLPRDYQEILAKKFGKDLNQNNTNWNRQEENIYYKKIRPLILEGLGEPIVKKANKRSRDLVGKLKLNDKSELEKILDGMYPEYIELIQKKYGINYDENNKLSIEEEEILSGKIMQALVRRAELLVTGKELKPMQRRCYDKDSEDDKMENNNKSMVNQPVPVNKILRVEKGIQPPPLAVYENGYPNSEETIKDEPKTEVKEEIKEEINVAKIDVSKEIVENNKSKENVENNIVTFFFLIIDLFF